MKKTLNTYLDVTICVSHTGEYRTGRIFTSNEAAKLELSFDVPYEQAKKELAHLMLRTGKMPRVYHGSVSIVYSLSAFLD